jgi:hypothetical protein
MSTDGGHLGWRFGSLDIILKVDLADRKFKIAAMTRLNFNIGPYGKNV